MTGRCTIDWYRGWIRHAKEGCVDCARRLREYNTQAKRDERVRTGVPKKRTYPPEFKKAVVQAARKRGARAAADEHGISQRLIYDWAKALGVRPKGRQ